MTTNQAPSPTHITRAMASRAADFIERPQINPLLTGTRLSLGLAFFLGTSESTDPWPKL
jgi:hypothetical protein